jgi:integrase
MLFDAAVRGFGVRISASGGKSFVAQYRVAGIKRRMALGEFGTLTVDQARNRARAVLGKAAEGRDPFSEARARADAHRSAQAEAKTQAATDAFTVERLVVEWRNDRAEDRRAAYLHEVETTLHRNLPDWMTRPAASITPDDAIAALARIKLERSTVAANRTKSYAGAVFSWAAARRQLPSNPLKALPRPGDETPRERVLAHEEIAAIWRGCDALSAPLAGFVRVLLLTAQRREEVASMRWSELDDPASPTLWTLPGRRAKNHRTHLVHLSEPVREILKVLPRIAGSPFVFTSRGDNALSAYSFAKNKIIAELRKKGTEIADWRYHDFRRSCVTHLAGLGVPPHISDKLLNHTGGAIAGVAAIYQRNQFLEERQRALDIWANYVTAAVKGKPLNVVPLARAVA